MSGHKLACELRSKLTVLLEMRCFFESYFLMKGLKLATTYKVMNIHIYCMQMQARSVVHPTQLSEYAFNVKKEKNNNNMENETSISSKAGIYMYYIARKEQTKEIK